ncbi:MAG: type II secretion system protein [Nitrospinota bacterium]
MDSPEAKETNRTSPQKTCDGSPLGRRAADVRGWRAEALLSGDGGFTLVETGVTLFLAGVLAAILLTFVKYGERATSGALRVSEATALSSSLMSLLLSGADAKDAGTAVQGGREYRWKASFLRLPGERLESVDLTVEWTEPTGPRALTVSTLRVRGSGTSPQASSPASGGAGAAGGGDEPKGAEPSP